MRKFKFTTLLLALFLGFTTQAQFLQLSVVSQTNLQIMNMSDYDVNSALQAITMQTFKAYNPAPMGVLNECTAVPIISTASNITYTTANLNWVAPEGGSGNYKVQWNDSDDFTSVIGEESVSAEQYSISGLTNKTTYYYRVQSVCDNSELSEWSAVESFQTGGYTPIEVTGFNQDVIAEGNTPASSGTTAKVDADGMVLAAEGYFQGNDNRQRLPLNRVLHNGTHGNAQPANIKYLLNSYTENNAINLPGGSGTFTLVTPEYYENLYLTGFTGNGTASLSIIVVYEDDTEQSFSKSLGDWWGGSTYVVRLNGRVNRNTDIYDNSTDNPRFYQITIDGLDQSKAVKEIVIQNTYGNSGSRIANIFAVSGLVPPTCPSPSNMLVSNITVSTAQLAWTAPANEPSNGYEWEVILSSDGSVVDNGTTTATSADVSGLNPNNTYKARVKALCDAGDFSDWIESTEFNTPCVAVADFPWTEGFESGNTNSNIVPTLGCWNEELVSGSTKWKFVNQNGNNSISPRTGSLMAGFRVTSSGPTSKLVTPSFDFTNLNIPQLTFYYTNVAWYSDIDELKVYYKKDISDANWTLIPGATYTNEKSSWEEVEIVLPEAENATAYVIAFEAKSNYAYGLTIDDISIDEAPSCLEPTILDTEIISISSVNITWTEAITQAESYEWEVRTSGTAGSGAEGLFESGSTEISITSVEIVNLETDIEYTFYLRSKCSDSDYSTWTSTTFELGYCTPSVGSCYDGDDHLISVELGSLLSEGLTCSPVYEDLSSTQNAIPDISAGTDIELKTNSHEHATVWIDFNQNGIFESSEFTHIGKGNNTTVISVPLDAKHGQTKMRLISKYGGAVGPEDACTFVQYGSSRDYLVNVIVATTCEEPTNIIAENITHNSATINWTASTSEPANGYDIYFASSSDNPAEDATPSATVDAGVTTYDLSGLTAETNYYVWVRSVCDETTNSQWEGPASFTTEEEPTYTLVINATNGTVTGEGSYLENANVTIEATPSTGYDFVNWTDENGEVSTENPYTFTMPANNITLTANFAEENVEPTEYALTLTVDPVDAGTVTGAGNHQAGAEVDITATAAEGYEFVKWTNGEEVVSTDANFTFTMPANDLTLTANFAEETVEPTEYALTLVVDPVDAGTVTGAGNHQAGAEVDITATAAEGYEFVEWTNGEEVVSTDANFTFTMPANDLTLTANFAEETVEPTEYALTLVVDPVDAGTVTGAGNHQAGAEVEITATAAEGYEFVEWTNGEEVVSTDANFTFTMPASDVTLIANFAEENVEPTKYTLTLTISPENAGTVSGGGEYAEGEEVTISTTAVNEDFVFLGWTNGTDTISNDAQFVFTMINDDVTLVAHYRDHTSISENDMSGIQIYPNPSLGIFNVVADKTYDLQIVDMTGRLVLYENITEGTNSVDIQHVQTGVYFVRLISNDDIKTIRIVKN